MAKIVVVTGATRGLGLAIARRCLEDGYRVVAVGRTPSAEFSELQTRFDRLLVFAAYDFSNLGGIHDFATKLTREHGRPWGLVNNAALGRDGVLATLHESDISELLRVNVEAPILLTKYLLRPMLLNCGGRIINVSSIVSTTGFAGLSVYAATKAALSGFTRSLAREVGRVGITVNTVAPGFMATDMTASLDSETLDVVRRRSPMRRLAGVDDAAAAVSFLLGDQAANITGTTLTVDAGSTA